MRVLISYHFIIPLSVVRLKYIITFYHRIIIISIIIITITTIVIIDLAASDPFSRTLRLYRSIKY